MEHIKLITAATATVAAVSGLYYLYSQLQSSADSASSSATAAAQSFSPAASKATPTPSPSPSPAAAAVTTPSPAPSTATSVKSRSYASIASSAAASGSQPTTAATQPVKHAVTESASATKAATIKPTPTHASIAVPATASTIAAASVSTPAPVLPSCFAPLLSFFPRFQVDQPSIRVITASQLPPPYNQLLNHTTNMTPTLSAFWCHQEVGLHVLDRVEDHGANQIRRWIKLEVADNVCELSSDSSKQAVADKKKANSTWASKLKQQQQQATPIKKTFASPKPGRMRFQESVQKVAPTTPASETKLATSATPGSATSSTSSSSSSSSSSAPSTSSTSILRTPVEFGSIHIHLNNIPESLHADLRSGAIPFATLLKKHSLIQKVQPQNFFSLEYSEALCKALKIPYFSDIRSLFGRCNIIRDEQDRIICEVVEIIPPIHMDS